MTRRAWVLLLLVGGLALAGTLSVAWLLLAPRRVPAGQPDLAALDATTLDAFHAAFDDRAGSVRVLVMLSPT